MSVKLWYVISKDRYEFLSRPRPPTELSEDKVAHPPTLPTPAEKSNSLIASLPTRLQQKGERFMVFLERNHDVVFHEDGTFSYKGKHVTNAHIVDLIVLALQNGYKKKCTYYGLKEFIALVEASHVPHTLLSNSFLEIMTQCK